MEEQIENIEENPILEKLFIFLEYFQQESSLNGRPFKNQENKEKGYNSLREIKQNISMIYISFILQL